MLYLYWELMPELEAQEPNYRLISIFLQMQVERLAFQINLNGFV